MEERVVDVKNIVKLDDDYEVALLDIMYEYTPFSLNQLKVKESDIRKESYEGKCVLNFEYDGVYNEADRRHVLASPYNSVTHVQLSEFHIWTYQRISSDKVATSIGVNSVYRHNKIKGISILKLLFTY